MFWASSCVLCREIVLISERPLSEIPLYTYTHRHTHTHTQTHRHIHTQTHTYTHTHTQQAHKHTNICTHKHTHTHKHANTQNPHTHVHSDTHAHTRTYTHLFIHSIIQCTLKRMFTYFWAMMASSISSLGVICRNGRAKLSNRTEPFGAVVHEDIEVDASSYSH